MADISRRITRKSLKAKRKSAIKTIKAQAKERIHEINVEYSMDAEQKKERAALAEERRELRAQRAAARLAYNERQPRPFTLGEDLFSSISNGLAAGLGAAAIVLLCIRAYYSAAGTPYVAAFAVFGTGLFVYHLTTMLFHVITPLAARRVFSVLDHCAAYFLAASLYTPILLTVMPAGRVTGSLCAVWCVTAALCVLYAVFNKKIFVFSVFTYIAFGVALVILLSRGRGVNDTSKAFLIIAGAAYAVSLVFFSMRNIKWTHALFHVFVIGANVLSFFAVYYLLD